MIFYTEKLPEGIHASLRGSLFLYYEAQQIISGEKPGDLVEAQAIGRAMSNILIAGFYSFNRIGRVSDYFAQVPFPPNPDVQLEPPLIPLHVVFTALAEGQSFLETQQKKEFDSQNIYVATVGRNNVGKGLITSHLQKNMVFKPILFLTE